MSLDGIKWAGLESIEPLRQGGMAELFLAKKRVASTPKLLVIKRLQPRFADDELASLLFANEIEFHASLDHPHIVQLLDCGSEGSSLYMALEYMAQGDLFSTIGDLGRHSERYRCELVLRAFSEVSQALIHVHELGVHHDISPCNILCSSSLSFKLNDFGVAQKMGDDWCKDRLGRGKFRYMSPEQISGSHADPRSDLFSLAATMAETFSGRRLYGDKSADQILRTIRSGDYLKHFYELSLPNDLREIILRSVQPCPEDRFQSAREVFEALELARALRLCNSLPALPAAPQPTKELPPREIKSWARIVSFLLIVPILIFMPWISRTLSAKRPLRQP